MRALRGATRRVKPNQVILVRARLGDQVNPILDQIIIRLPFKGNFCLTLLDPDLLIIRSDNKMAKGCALSTGDARLEFLRNQKCRQARNA